MTLDEVLNKRNEERERRKNLKEEIEQSFDNIISNALVEKLLHAEYGWGYWDAALTIMKNCGMKELNMEAL